MMPWIASRGHVPKIVHRRVPTYWQSWLTEDSGVGQIVYIGGDSWMQEYQIKTQMMQRHPNWLVINRSKGGNSNDEIIRLLDSDKKFLESIDLPVTVIVAFSEVGRHQNEIDIDRLKKHSSVTDYLKQVQIEQHERIKQIVKDFDNVFITTAYVPNTFNQEKTVLDHVPNLGSAPCECFNLHSHLYTWCVEQGFPIKDIMNDIDRVNQYVSWLLDNPAIDDSVHIEADTDTAYFIYNNFFDNIMKGR